jgi:hypothetical protein
MNFFFHSVRYNRNLSPVLLIRPYVHCNIITYSSIRSAVMMAGLLGWVLVLILCHLCAGISVVIEVEQDSFPESNCEETQTNITSFLQDTYSLFYNITGSNLPLNVTIILPYGLCPEDSLPSRHSGDARIVLANSETMLLQYGGCGVQGLRLEYGMQVATEEDFVLHLMQHLYGVFPETGYQGVARFPVAYQTEGKVALTSCTNVPIKGNFSLDCLQSQVCFLLYALSKPISHLQDCSSYIEENQTNITSSLLFSSDRTLFPEVRFLI